MNVEDSFLSYAFLVVFRESPLQFFSVDGSFLSRCF